MDIRPGDREIKLAGERVLLCPERALVWPRGGDVFIADLHLGKAEAFQRGGVPIPSTLAVDDLARLSSLLDRAGARALWVLGDLIHGVEAGDTEGLEPLHRAHPSVRIHLVAGNHDRHLATLPASWGVEVHEEVARVGPFILRHEASGPVAGAPVGETEAYELSGHLHPVVRLRGGRDVARLPCFALGTLRGMLPAFAAFTGGCEVDRTRARVFPVAEGAVLEV